MAIAGAVVLPIVKEEAFSLSNRLDALPGVEVAGATTKGIALVIEGRDLTEIQKLSERIQSWPEVLSFQVAYVNWDDEKEEVSEKDWPEKNTIVF